MFEKAPAWLIGVGLVGIVSFLAVQLFTGYHYCIGNDGGSIGWRGKGDTCHGGGVRAREGQALNFFPADKVQGIWNGESGDGMTYDFSDVVPDQAKGVILKVIVTSDSGHGSFACADSNGAFPSGLHYLHNGVTNYSKAWAGGVVFCPIKDNKTITWRTRDNHGASNTVRSIASVLGWF